MLSYEFFKISYLCPIIIVLELQIVLNYVKKQIKLTIFLALKKRLNVFGLN